jgi:hypothetical protein
LANCVQLHNGRFALVEGVRQLLPESVGMNQCPVEVNRSCIAQPSEYDYFVGPTMPGHHPPRDRSLQ